MVGQTASLPCRYKAKLDLEPAYMQVLVDYLFSSCIFSIKQKSLQVGSNQRTFNLHLQVVFENPNPTFRLLCVTIVRPDQLRALQKLALLLCCNVFCSANFPPCRRWPVKPLPASPASPRFNINTEFLCLAALPPAPGRQLF